MKTKVRGWNEAQNESNDRHLMCHLNDYQKMIVRLIRNKHSVILTFLIATTNENVSTEDMPQIRIVFLIFVLGSIE